jgi:hypothetical protein
MATKSIIACSSLFMFLMIHCGKESVDPEFERPPVIRRTTQIMQPGVTAFRIVAPRPEVRRFELYEEFSNPLTIIGERFPPVHVKIKMRINQDGHASIVMSDFPKESVGQDIVDIVRTWNRFRPYKTGTIKYLINIGGHEFRVDTRELYTRSQYLQYEIINGALGKVNNYFQNVDLNARLDF